MSDTDGSLERTFLSPATRRAMDMIAAWMRDAGMRTWVDEVGNVHGRGLHSFTFQLNFSAFCVKRGTCRGCFGVLGMLGDVEGGFCFRNGSS